MSSVTDLASMNGPFWGCVSSPNRDWILLSQPLGVPSGDPACWPHVTRKRPLTGNLRSSTEKFLTFRGHLSHPNSLIPGFSPSPPRRNLFVSLIFVLREVPVLHILRQFEPNMVAAAVRMRTPSAMFMSRGAAAMRRPQVSYKFQEVIQYVLLSISNQSYELILMSFLRAETNCPPCPLSPASMLPSV